MEVIIMIIILLIGSVLRGAGQNQKKPPSAPRQRRAGQDTQVPTTSSTGETLEQPSKPNLSKYLPSSEKPTKRQSKSKPVSKRKQKKHVSQDRTSSRLITSKLNTASGLKQGILYKEILGPPKSKRR